MTIQCVFILPYFGRFNNYFPLFLRSCAENPTFHWLIFTDDDRPFHYPQNVKVVPMTFTQFKSLASNKLKFAPALPSPYKLCDMKPAYGFLFEDYIRNYEYWGHCDCDVVFGNLSTMVTPALQRGYDKLFSMGHMVIYRNTAENNRRFMHDYQGQPIYRKAFTTDRIYVFDEDGNPQKNPERNNVHSIFLAEHCAVDTDDPSLNFSTTSDRFITTTYITETNKWIYDKRPMRCFWDNSRIINLVWNESRHEIDLKEYPYVHLQSRRMRIKNSTLHAPLIEIRPDGFYRANALPTTKREMQLAYLKLPTRFTVDRFVNRVEHKISSLIIKR